MNLIKDARTIAGLFREALFHSRSVQIISADYGDITALITDLQEDSSRDISTERQLFLTSSITINNLSDSFSAKIRCAFPQFVLFWNGTITKSETGELVVTLPAEVHLENSRTQARVELIKSTSPSGPILVNTDTFCTEGIFQIEDISEGGFGGSLRVFPEMPIRIGTQLQGRIKTPTGIIEVNGQVVQVSLHSAANTSQADAIYRVGVKNQTFNQSTVHSPPTQSERRKFKRVPVQLDINLLSPYHPEHVVSGLILDASLAGFLARLKDISDAILLPVGCIVQIPQTSILAQVISLEDENVRFQIVQSNSKDRVEWFKRLTPYLNKNTSHSTATGMDIIELFCESGALASTYLKNQRRFAEDFLEAFTARDSQGSWIYRWIERDEEGKIRGHNSIVRLSDHTWSWGSVAGMAQKDRKISRTFVPEFARYIHDFSIVSQPCPSIMMTWIEGHPYWNEFETFITSSQNHVLCGIAKAQYFRYSPVRNENVDTKSWNPQWIKASDYGAIHRIRLSLDGQGLLFLADMLDFSISTFGSPILAAQMSDSQHHFERRYLLASNDDKEYLIVFQSFPIGSSPHRSEHVPWIIPLQNTLLTDAQRKTLIETVRSIGLSHGFSFPGSMEISSNQANGMGDQSKPAKRMMICLFHPDALVHFYDRDEIKEAA